MLITSTSKKTFGRVALDIVGPLQPTQRGNKYILSMQDDLTKYTIFDAISSMDAETVADSFFRQFISRFGIPDSILTDQGSNFTSHLMKDLCKMLKVRKMVTTPYHPQTKWCTGKGSCNSRRISQVLYNDSHKLG